MTFKSLMARRTAGTAALAISLCLQAPAMAAGPGSSQSADELITAAQAVLSRIDSKQEDSLWQTAAPFMKALINQSEFQAQTREARAALGEVTERRWASVTRLIYPADSKTPPPGLYANVDFASVQKDGKTSFEMVSFRFNEQGFWELTGYRPRQAQ
ncbi:MAG: DUF4019 domain-containing protein [Comamonadaceae bacterium]|nr:DUF4019 domain-containing protein [Comamonadaceae bacterium]